MRQSVILLIIFLTTTLGAVELADWAGVWVDTETDAHFRIEKRGDDLSVITAFNYDTGEVYQILRSNWDGINVSWTIYIRSSEVTLTYTSARLSGDSMYTTWQNEWNNGEEILQRKQSVLSGSLSDYEGVWVDTEINVHMTVKRRGNRLEVVSAVDMDDYEAFDIIDQSFFNGVLDWTIYIPSTDVWINYSTVRLDGDKLNVNWETEFDKGDEILMRFQ
ncbi:MAG: hypothetical protein K8R90_01860 [Candidatus Cloacimonetes bacterium]|nr:hypothetical protein [Candidatus Cloacimonadota bacterium]